MTSSTRRATLPSTRAIGRLSASMWVSQYRNPTRSGHVGQVTGEQRPDPHTLPWIDGGESELRPLGALCGSYGLEDFG